MYTRKRRMFSEKTSCTIIFFHYTCSMPIGYAFATYIDSIILFIHLTLDTNKNKRHMCICVVIDNDVMNQRKVHIQKKTSMTSRKRKYHFILMHYGRIFVISIVVKIWRFIWYLDHMKMEVNIVYEYHKIQFTCPNIAFIQ